MKKNASKTAQDARAFSGRTRDRKTKSIVKLGDKLSRIVITVGGIGTIVAVLGVCVFLLSVALPLFFDAEVESETSFAVQTAIVVPVRVKLDEQIQLAWALDQDGFLETWRLDNGASLGRRRVAAAGKVSAVMADPASPDIAFGFDDGRLQVGKIEIETKYLAEEEIPEELSGIEPGGIQPYDGGIASLTPLGQFRLDRVKISIDDPFNSGGSAPIHRLDYVVTIQGPRLCSLGEDGALRYLSIERRRNLLTGKYRIRSEEFDLGALDTAGGLPDFMLLSTLGDQLYLAWKNGKLLRINVLDPEQSFHAEELTLVDDDESLTHLDYLLGRTTLIVGSSSGRTSAWFGVKPKSASTKDGIVTRRAHELAGGGSAMTASGVSTRSRLLLSGYADGGISVQDVTAEAEVLRLEVAVKSSQSTAIEALAISPREDAVLAITNGKIALWRVDLKHPTARLGTLFGRVWYEGSEEPSHTWQTTGGSDDFEPKLGFLPMVFGTLKATFYSLLFGVPIALLAAIYTSEFMSPKAKGRVKPAIEFMASLPSVVLGFLAALVFAPFIENVIPVVIASFFLMPLAFVLGAYLWQLMPQERALRFRSWRLATMGLCLPAGLLLAWLMGPLVERLFFESDIRSWLDGQVGSAIGGWLLLVLPLTAGVAITISGRLSHPWIRKLSADWSRRRFATFELLRFAALCALVFAVAVGIAWMISAMGFDARGSFLGTYIQRNAFVVGFAMGFAIIPIIYTIAEDALAAVPTHLRAASLGAGATEWQTATRIIIPTAASGLFSAVMIGLGRAVGETMIVLMAAGNTAIMDANIFNGFRTLAATIAVEIPEAVRDGTHYRTLYLAALVLFSLTFVINALAETIRQRFRKRAFQL
ncbi:MAG: ABC transporter permease subunit [Planctomycetota bacterium]